MRKVIIEKIFVILTNVGKFLVIIRILIITFVFLFFIVYGMWDRIVIFFGRYWEVVVIVFTLIVLLLELRELVYVENWENCLVDILCLINIS